MLKFHKTLATSLTKSTGILLFSSNKSMKAGAYKKVLDKNFYQTIAPELKDIKAGLTGTKVNTYTNDKKIRTISFVAIPDSVSRSASETKKHIYFKHSGELATKDNLTVILILDNPDHYEAAATALARHQKLYSRKEGAKEKTVHIIAFDKKGVVIPASPQVIAASNSVSIACKLVDMPPQELNPKAFTAEVKSLFRDNTSVKVSEIAGSKLLQQNMGGIHAVGRCAVEAPRLITAEYSPRGSKKTILLVGKGLTYDSGGLSLKISGGMVGMKSDMGGAAAVLGAFKTLVETKVKYKVILIIGAVENAIGPDAYRNDDILTMHSGKTVEVNNTDAEGRIVLADCMSYGCRKYKPDLVIDAATLTGAQMIATGINHAGVVSNRDDVEDLAVKVGKSTGDLVAPLPFAPEFYKEELKSVVADMRNSVKNRMNAQTSCAAQFIYNHVEDLDIPWLHIDLAGPSTTPSGLGSGYGVSLIANIANQY
ncbi:MAG: leucyl aminopeptidase family protein [Pseudobacteriovorax sp.]|nr:leucyl aminopeptidase family protein [Pseudobacteriovorax sp.]